MTTNSNDSKKFNSNIFLVNYGKDLFLDPLNFLWNNKVYLDNETLLDIKELVMDELDKKNASQEAKDKVVANIDKFIVYFKKETKGETKKVMIQELDDIFYLCLSLIWYTSMNVKKNTSYKSVDDYYKTFLGNLYIYRNRMHNIDEVDALYLMFNEILFCSRIGGDFHMIDALYNKLGEYLEANYKD